MSTAADILKFLETLTPAVLDAMGLQELQPLADAVMKLGDDIAGMIAKKAPPNLAAEVAAADVAADAAEDAKFPVK